MKILRILLFTTIQIEFAFLSLTYLFTSVATNSDLRRTDVAEGVLLVSYIMHELWPTNSQENH